MQKVYVLLRVLQRILFIWCNRANTRAVVSSIRRRLRYSMISLCDIERNACSEWQVWSGDQLDIWHVRLIDLSEIIHFQSGRLLFSLLSNEASTTDWLVDCLILFQLVDSFGVMVICLMATHVEKEREASWWRPATLNQSFVQLRWILPHGIVIGPSDLVPDRSPLIVLNISFNLRDKDFTQPKEPKLEVSMLLGRAEARIVLSDRSNRVSHPQDGDRCAKRETINLWDGIIVNGLLFHWHVWSSIHDWILSSTREPRYIGGELQTMNWCISIVGLACRIPYR